MTTRKEWRSEAKKWLERTQMARGQVINFVFEKESDMSNEDKDAGIIAATSSDPAYKTHTIYVRDKWLKENKKKDQLADAACHETIHILTSPVRQLIKDIIKELPKSKQKTYTAWFHRENEEQTTHLADIMVNEAKTWRNN